MARMEPTPTATMVGFSSDSSQNADTLSTMSALDALSWSTTSARASLTVSFTSSR
jgi:hypothetical protein